MYRFSILFLLIFSTSIFADVCICQYPKDDAKHGAGYDGEVGFYKLGCQLWLAKEKECRKHKTMDVNDKVNTYLDKHLKSSEKVHLGFVGHWSSSHALISYLKDVVEPIRVKYSVPVLVDNTACSAMDQPELISDYLKTIPNKDSQYIKVVGNQNTSIGMWDKVLPLVFDRADLYATVDSREVDPIYPECRKFENRRCTGFQHGDSGLCTTKSGDQKELICLGKVVKKQRGYRTKYKIKKIKRWRDFDKSKELVKEYIKVKERELKVLMYRIGLEPNHYESMLDKYEGKK